MDINAAPETNTDAAGAPSGLCVARHQTLELVRVREFINPEEQSELAKWAINMRPHLNENGPGRTFRKVQQLPSVPPIYRRIRFRVQDLFGVPADAQPEPRFGWYVSVISEGGAVHTHMDPTQPGRRHLRCNLFLQLPIVGGFPVIDEQNIEVEERMLLGFYPSEKRHSSLAVQGDRWRIICSFGYLVPDTHVLPGSPSSMSQPSVVRRQMGLSELAI